MVLLRVKGKQSRQMADSEWAALKSKTVTSHSEIYREKRRLFFREKVQDIESFLMTPP